MTETHQNKAQKAKFLDHKASVLVLKREKAEKVNIEGEKNVYGPYFNDELALL